MVVRSPSDHPGPSYERPKLKRFRKLRLLTAEKELLSARLSNNSRTSKIRYTQKNKVFHSRKSTMVIRSPSDHSGPSHECPKLGRFRKLRLLTTKKALLSARLFNNSRTSKIRFTYKNEVFHSRKLTMVVRSFSDHPGQSYELLKLGRFQKLR